MGTVLGQTMRALAVARRLVLAGDEVLFGYVGQPNAAVDSAGVPIEYVPEPDGQRPRFDRRQMAGGAPDPQASAAFVDWMQRVAGQEEQLARRFEPDVVLAGSLSGPAVARAVDVPSAFVCLQPRGAATLRMLAGPAVERLRANIASAAVIIVEGLPEMAADDARLAWGQAAHVHHVGPLLLVDPDQLPPRSELRRRLGVGSEPLVWLTVGGGSDLLGGDFLALASRAMRELPECRALLSLGFHVGDVALDLPPHVRAERFFPGEETIAASDAVVFHGGSSTLMHLVGLGRPGVALPSIDEQRDNAAALQRLGAGLTLDADGLTPTSLAAAIRRLLTEPSFRDAAGRLAELAAGYGGAARAAEIVHRVARRG